MNKHQSTHASLKDIAKALGISKAAVSLALNDSHKISAERKRQVKAAAAKMGYKRNALLSSAMSNIKSDMKGGFLETIVVVNANKFADATARYPIYSRYEMGIDAESAELGYAVFKVWLHDSTLNAQRLSRILQSRGIRGGIIIGNLNDNRLPSAFKDVWGKFKFVSVGLKTENPELDYIAPDKFIIARHTAQTAIKSGYQRPAMIVDAHIDALVDGRFSGGFASAQLALPPEARIPPFFKTPHTEEHPTEFLEWIEKYKPDAIFSMSNAATTWIEMTQINKMLPKWTKIIDMERDNNGWIGFDINYELVGRFAVRNIFYSLNLPIKLSNLNASTATIVQPRWNPQLTLQKK